jgi:hypothetical protein
MITERNKQKKQAISNPAFSSFFDNQEALVKKGALVPVVHKELIASETNSEAMPSRAVPIQNRRLRDIHADR